MVSRYTNTPDRFTYYWLVVIYFLSATEAYQIFSVPLQWIGSLLAILSFILFLVKDRTCHVLYLFPLLLVIALFFFSMLGWLFWSSRIEFEHLLPSGATTEYYQLISLRYLQYIVFVAVYL